MKLKIIALLLIGMTTAFAQNVTSGNDGMFAEIETSKGKIVLELEFKKTPLTVANFVSLAEGNNPIVNAQYKGKPFFDGLKFHRVIANFMIQGGDPMGNGSGDAGYKFKDEITDLKHTSGGILSMANSGPATNSSQFFITHKETPWLDGKHTVFGHVTSGMDVVNSIAQDDLMKKVTIIRKGAEAKTFDAVKIFADYYATKAEDDKRIATLDAENKKKIAEAAAEAKKVYNEKYSSVKKDKVAYLAGIRSSATKSETGLEYKLIKKGTGNKPADGTPIFIHYAGYLEDGTLFDSSYADVNKTYGKYDANRDAQNGYQPFQFSVGKKDGLIPGFIEALGSMSIGDRVVAFIPSKLGYGERGAGDVIPPNSNIIFEIEMLDAMPVTAPKK